MQRVPTSYGFSILILVLVLMILNHFIYLGILERTLASQRVETPQEQPAVAPAQENDPIEDTSELDIELTPEEAIEDKGSPAEEAVEEQAPEEEAADEDLLDTETTPQ